MMVLEHALRAHQQISDFKINTHDKTSYELFFVKGKLETVRSTSTTDTEITVYCKHSDYLGEAKFNVYPSTTDDELTRLIQEAVEKAVLINNKPYELPASEEASYEIESNLSDYSAMDLAAEIADIVFSANDIENGSINSLEIFINRHHEKIDNSRGIHKTQIRFDAMVEAIPTYNGENQSVELYEQYNFSSLDKAALHKEISGMMTAVKARYEAVHPEAIPECRVILNPHELAELFGSIAYNLNYATVYTKSAKFAKGDSIQENPTGDRITITMLGEETGNVHSAKFDNDGLKLNAIEIVKDGKACNYFGSNRYGQYLQESPTGGLRCIGVNNGSCTNKEKESSPYLEIISMSGLQVDFFNDYIGGEIRLGYYYDGNSITPVTGISISGSLTDALNNIVLSEETSIHNGYSGPAYALLSNMKVF